MTHPLSGLRAAVMWTVLLPLSVIGLAILTGEM